MRPRSMILSEALRIDVPTTVTEREPNVPMPWVTRSVSPHTTRTRSGSTPSIACGDLPERRLMPLAVIVGAEQHGQVAARIEPHLGEFLARPPERSGGDFDRVGDAAGRAACRCARIPARRLAKPFQSAASSGKLHILLELAAVVGEDEPGLERHRVRRNEIAPPDLDAVDAELVGGDIDHLLDRQRRLRAALPRDTATSARYG